MKSARNGSKCDAGSSCIVSGSSLPCSTDGTTAEANFGKFESNPCFQRLLQPLNEQRVSRVSKEVLHETDDGYCCLRRAWRCCSHLTCGCGDAERNDPGSERRCRPSVQRPAGALGQGRARPPRLACGSATVCCRRSAPPLRGCGSAPGVGAGMAERLRRLVPCSAGVEHRPVLGSESRMGSRMGPRNRRDRRMGRAPGMGPRMGSAPRLGLE